MHTTNIRLSVQCHQITSLNHLPETHSLRIHLIESAPYFRFLLVGLGLLIIMRYRPQGILPEKVIKQ